MKVNYRNPSELSAAIGATAAQSVSYLRQSAHEAIRDQVRAYFTEKAQIEDNNRLTGAAILDDVAALRQRVTSAINDLEATGKDRVERVRAAISKATQEP
jgi:lipase chaperone LimK